MIFVVVQRNFKINFFVSFVYSFIIVQVFLLLCSMFVRSYQVLMGNTRLKIYFRNFLFMLEKLKRSLKHAYQMQNDFYYFRSNKLFFFVEEKTENQTTKDVYRNNNRLMPYDGKNVQFMCIAYSHTRGSGNPSKK